jgi:DNA/RNA-binding protein KIN17
MEMTEQDRQSKMLQRQLEAMKKLESRSKGACAAGGGAKEDAETFEDAAEEEEDSEGRDDYEDFDDDDLEVMKVRLEGEEAIGEQGSSGLPSGPEPQATVDTSVRSKTLKHVAPIARGTVAFSLSSKASAAHSGSGSKQSALFGSDDSSDDDVDSAPAAPAAKRQMSAVERIASEIQEKKRREDVPKVINMRDEKFKRRENWLAEGIVVKIMDKELGDGRFYKAKAHVRSLLSSFIAEVKLVESSHVIKIDQRDLETVLPAVRPALLYI